MLINPEPNVPAVIISKFHEWELYLLTYIYSDFVNDNQNEFRNVYLRYVRVEDLMV